VKWTLDQQGQGGLGAAAEVTMNQRPSRDLLPDCAAATDQRGLAIAQVGVRGLRWPVRVMDRHEGEQPTIATLDLLVGLPADQKGTHMSRLVEAMEETGGELSLRSIPALLASLQRRLEAAEVYVTARFPYFLRKRAPVSGVASWLDVDCTFQAERRGDQVGFTLRVAVPVTSLCPCSKAISNYGAHNQRSVVEVAVAGERMIWIEEVVGAIESAASSPVWTLLKREDEKYVTELAYDNPRFVEDLVREVARAIQAIEGVQELEVTADNQESIHNHSAWARLVWRRDEAEPTPAPPVPEERSPGATFGSWLRSRRQALRLAQNVFAERIGVSGSFLCKVEQGEKTLSPDGLDRLSLVLGLDRRLVWLRAGLLPPELQAQIAADPEALLRWAARSP
jgi:GTP cyclohydrolase I